MFLRRCMILKDLCIYGMRGCRVWCIIFVIEICMHSRMPKPSSFHIVAMVSILRNHIGCDIPQKLKTFWRGVQKQVKGS